MYVPPNASRDLAIAILSVLSTIWLMFIAIMLIGYGHSTTGAIGFLASPFLGIKFAKLVGPKKPAPKPIKIPGMVESNETYLEKMRREAIEREEAEAASEPEYEEVVEYEPERRDWDDDGSSAAGTVGKVAAAGLSVLIGGITGGLREQSRKKDAAARRAYKRKWNKPMGGKPVRTPKAKPPKKPRTPNQARGDRKRSATMKKKNMNKKVKF